MHQLATLPAVSQADQRLYRAFLLRDELRLLHHLPHPQLGPAHLDAWLAWAARSRLTASKETLPAENFALPLGREPPRKGKQRRAGT